MKFIFQIFLLGWLLLTLASCSMQQRRYRPGITLSWHYNTRTHKSEVAYTGFQPSEKQSSESRPKKTAAPAQHSPDPLLAANKVSTAACRLDKSKPPARDSCDVIVFRDGRQVNAMLLDVGPDQLRYRRCDDIVGPIFVTRTNDVLMIKYADGRKRIFAERKESIQNIYREPATAKTLHPSAIPSLVLAIVGFLGLWLFGLGIILLIVSLVMANRVIKDDRASPGVYSGVNTARIAKFIDIFILALLALALVLVFYYLFFLI